MKITYSLRPLTLGLLSVACIVSCAQSLKPATGSLDGKLTDNHSLPLAQATVTVRNLTTGETQQTITQENGAYRFQSLGPGEYCLSAKLPSLGHGSSLQGSVADILVSAHHTTRVQAALILELPQPSPAIETDLRNIDPVTPAVTTQIPAEELTALPLAGRDWQAFAAITPAGNPQGASTNSGAIDSIDAEDAESLSLPSSEALETTASIDEIPTAPTFRNSHDRAEPLGESAVLSFATQTGNASPSQDPTGVVRLTTGHGGAALHGQAFFLTRQNFFNAQNPFTQTIQQTAPASGIDTAIFSTYPYTPPNTRQTFGIGLGGQIKPNKLFRSDKLFWFTAFDGLLRNDPAIATVRHPAGFFAQPSLPDLQMLAARLNLPGPALLESAASTYSAWLQQIDSLLGPVPRTLRQLQGFARLDWQPAERHRLTAELNAAYADAPNGALTRASETYGSHSFGNSRASDLFALAKVDSFLTANLLSTAALEFQHRTQSQSPNSPSSIESPLLPFTFGQLPQIAVDSRNGLILGAPARLGKGDSPDEIAFLAQESVSWVHGNHLIQAGAAFDHIADRLFTLTNQAGTYSYADLLNFISDTAAIETFGFAGFNPGAPYHNCDATGRVYNRGGQDNLGGLGPLPCYAWFSERIGPSHWNLSTNNYAAFANEQWQPFQNLTLSAGLRVEFQQLPPVITLVQNPALPQTQHLPQAGLNWAPRIALAWVPNPASHTVLRMGAGLYYGRIEHAALLAALTQTGSPSADLNFFFKPTDSGAPIFPVNFPAAPQNALGQYAVVPGAVSFAPHFRDRQIDQAVFSLEQPLPARWTLAVSALASLGRRLPISVDTNLLQSQPASTITYSVVDPIQAGPIKADRLTVPLYTARPNTGYQQLAEIQSRANSTYLAELIQLTHNAGHGLSLRAHYLYAHATDFNPNESGSVAVNDLLDPADFRLEYGTSNLDIRNSASATLLYRSSLKLRDWAGLLANGWALAAVGQYRSGLPFTMHTTGYIPGFYDQGKKLIQGVAPGLNGSGGDNRVYGLGSNGIVYNIGRNTFRYPATWTADLRLAKRFPLSQHSELEILGETFNLFNHQNVTRIETTGYTLRRGASNGELPTLNFLTGLTKTGQPSATPEFGKPLDVNATNFFRPREFQLGLRARF